MHHLEQYFPDIAQAIQQQRLVDAELDEICTDHAMLVADIRDVAAATDEGVRREQAAIRESLDGLAQEIRAKLEALNGDGGIQLAATDRGGPFDGPPNKD